MERLGLGYDDLRRVRPDVIYCAITGFGHGGGAALPGYDLLVQAVGGLMSVTGTEPGEPTKAGVALVDVLAGLHALSGILAALAHRDRTGEGQRVDTDLFSVLLSSMVNQASGFLGAGVVPAMMGNRHPSIAPYQTFDTADRPIAVAVGNDRAVHRVQRRDRTARARPRSALRHQPAPGGQPGCVVRVAGTGVEAARCRTLVHHADLGRCARRARSTTCPRHSRSPNGSGIAATVQVPGSPAPQVANPVTLSATPVTYRCGPPVLGDSVAVEKP